MKIDAERLEQIQAVIYQEKEGVAFYVKGTDPKKIGHYWLSEDGKIGRFGPENKNGEAQYNSSSAESFLSTYGDKELVAQIFIGWEAGKETHQEFDDWAKLADYLNISKMVVLTTKVPAVIAKRLKYFIGDDTVSATLRDLVYKYVKENWVEQADSLILREDV